MQFRIGFMPFFSLTVKVTRTEGGAYALIHIWILKLGLHFGVTAQD